MPSGSTAAVGFGGYVGGSRLDAPPSGGDDSRPYLVGLTILFALRRVLDFDVCEWKDHKFDFESIARAVSVVLLALNVLLVRVFCCNDNSVTVCLGFGV